MKGKRARSRPSRRTGTVTKAIRNCLWVRMDDDGTEWSGGKPYWKVLPATQQHSGPPKPPPPFCRAEWRGRLRACR